MSKQLSRLVVKLEAQSPKQLARLVVKLEAQSAKFQKELEKNEKIKK